MSKELKWYILGVIVGIASCCITYFTSTRPDWNERLLDVQQELCVEKRPDGETEKHTKMRCELLRLRQDR